MDQVAVKMLTLVERIRVYREEYKSKMKELRGELEQVKSTLIEPLREQPGQQIEFLNTSPELGGDGKLRVTVLKTKQHLSNDLLLKGLNKFFNQWPNKSPEEIENMSRLALKFIMDEREVKETVDIVRTVYRGTKRRRIVTEES